MSNEPESSQPDYIDRWHLFWDVWSKTLPLDINEWEYADCAMQAFEEFEKQDADAQATAISKAWGIIQTMPKRRPRKPPEGAIVIPPPPRWEPCPYWRGETCKQHKHVILSAMRKAQSLFELYAPFVRRRIRVELMPIGGKGRYDVDAIEGEVWFAVGTRIAEYVPTLQNYCNEKKEWWTASSEEEQARAQCWLRSIVRSTVIDAVRGAHADKRDIDKEEPLPDYAGDRGIVNPDDPTFARPTPIVGDSVSE